MKRQRIRPTAMSASCIVAVTAVLSSSSLSLAGDPVIQPKSGDPLYGLTVDQLDRFFKGKERFEHAFTAQEGLGPTFNRESCAVCHSMPNPGGSGSIAVTRYGALNFFDEYDPLEEFGGSLFQMSAIVDECADSIPTQEDVENLLGPGWGAISDDPNAWFPAVQRITNSALGAGLIEAIPDEDILAHATYFGGEPHGGSPPAGPSSNVAGHAHLVFSFEAPETPRVGRMGWKAQVATVLTFSADAGRNELGITNRFIGDDPAPGGDLDLLEWCLNLEGINDEAPHPNDQAHLDPYEEDVEFIDRITDFQRLLAPPPQTPKSGMTGEQVFDELGCAQCHISTWTTRDDPELEDAIRNKTIKPYSDFLLHDMGLGGDLIVQGDGGLQFMRTPSLWGLRDRDPLWHDGRVGGGTFEDRIHLMPNNNVIHWHNQFGSTAADAAEAFEQRLIQNPDDIAALIAFLNSLGRIEFDYNGDNFVDDEDFPGLIGCYTGTGGSYVGPRDNPMDDPCAVLDVDQNGTVDHIDFEAFLMAYEGLQDDCDLWLALADAVDPIGVPVPGECLGDTCPADLTGDGSVGVPDLLELLAAWGGCPRGEECPADLTGDGSVGVPDLLELLAAWGSCPD